MTVKFTNNASTTVGTGINASATSLTVASASSFPSLSGADDYCYLTIQAATSSTREVVKATALSSNTFTIVRAQDNTSAASFAAGDIVELRMTAALLTDVIDAATVEGVKTNFQYTPTAGQTVFSGADNASNTLIINQAALVSVYLNGIRLVQGSDYSVSSANNTVTLTAGVTTADIVDVEVFGNFTGQSGAAVAITGGAISGASVAATTLSASGTATLNTFVSNNITVSGGSINNVNIGATTAGTGRFSTLAATGDSLLQGNVTHNNTGAASKYFKLNVASSGDGHLLLQRNGTNYWQIHSDSSNVLKFDGLNGASSATFSGSVSANGDVESKGGNELRVYRTDNNAYGSIEYLTGAGGLKLRDVNGDGMTFAGASSNYLTIAGTGAATFSGTVGMVGGNATGKFAVSSTGVHPSYDFYNNGSSYFNGSVTVDDDLTVSGSVTADGLDVLSTTSGTSRTIRVASTASSGDNDATMIISNGGSGDAMLRFDYEGSNTDRARIGVSSSAQQLEFYTAGNNQRMLIDASGSVGVGTSGAPSFNTGSGLEIQRAGPATLRIEDTGSGGKPFEIYSDDAEGYVLNGRGSGMPMYFKTVNQLAMTIDTNQNVGIGSSLIPSDYKLEVQNSTYSGVLITNTSTSIADHGTVGFIDFGAGSSKTVVGRLAVVAEGTNENGGELVVETRAAGGSLSEKLRIDGSGAVIVNNAGGDAQIYLGGTSGTDRMYLARSGNDALLWNVDSGVMRFGTNNVQRMQVNASGNLNIGMPSGYNAEGRLHVYKGAAGKSWATDSADQLIVENSSSVAIDIRTPNADQGQILFSDAAARSRGRIGYYHGEDYMYFDTAGGLRLKIDQNGAVTKPYQPAFLAKPTSPQNNMGTSNSTINFGTEIYDQGSDFSSNTFTAPVTGKYSFNAVIRLDQISTDANYIEIKIVTSNRNYHWLMDPDGLDSNPAYWNGQISCLADMDAGDTAKVFYNQSGGSTTTDVSTESHFSGFLAC